MLHFVLLAGRYHCTQFLRVVRFAKSILIRDKALAVKFGKRFFHRVHAEAGSGLERRINLVGLALPNER